MNVLQAAANGLLVKAVDVHNLMIHAMIKYFPAFLTVVLYSCDFRSNPILLAESSIKLDSLANESVFLGFDEGDHLLFSFKEVNGLEIEQIEVSEYPSFTKFSDFKSKGIDSLLIKVPKQGVYEFSFHNSDSMGRILKYRVERIPAGFWSSEFNSNVHWKTLYDTAYNTIEEEYLVHEEYQPIDIVPPGRYYINSGSNATFKGGNSRMALPVELPVGTIQWYYELTAFREKVQAENAAKSFNLVGELANMLDQTGGLNIATNLLTQPPIGDVCSIYLIDPDNYNSFLQKTDFQYYPIGTRLNFNSGIVKIDWIPDKSLYLGIKNPDSFHGIHVAIEVVAIVRKQEWGIREIKEPVITQRKEPYLKN